MNFKPVHMQEAATAHLWRHLRERLEEPDANISHRSMPSWREHEVFVESAPYRGWWLIEEKGHILGNVYATRENALGIFVTHTARRRGIATRALTWVTGHIEPYVAIPGYRTAYWNARVNPGNEASARLFIRLGFSLVQHTYAALPEIDQ